MGIRENIINLRKQHGLTQDELAKIAGVSRGAVSQWEGGFSEPRMGAVQRMADYFGIKKGDLIEDAQDSDPDFDRLARAWRDMEPNSRAALLAAAESFAKHPGNVSGGGAPWMSPRRPRRRLRITRIPVFA